eukprot:TRINITY_DN56405_c0_g1_i1.p1 TRINITY_DN56405_c0_g1~~TRINITY_DN56405_c0_g1_i1.p1  ORF type:complete len:594 (-),score=85.80 TRINITY_DN56405_c0_g1_i1:189-1892(-)
MAAGAADFLGCRNSLDVPAAPWSDNQAVGAAEVATNLTQLPPPVLSTYPPLQLHPVAKPACGCSSFQHRDRVFSWLFDKHMRRLGFHALADKVSRTHRVAQCVPCERRIQTSQRQRRELLRPTSSQSRLEPTPTRKMRRVPEQASLHTGSPERQIKPVEKTLFALQSLEKSASVSPNRRIGKPFSRKCISSPRLDVLQGIQVLLEHSEVLRARDFDGPIRKVLHAIYTCAGRQGVFDALDIVREVASHKGRRAVQCWPAYLFSLLRRHSRKILRGRREKLTRESCARILATASRVPRSNLSRVAVSESSAAGGSLCPAAASALPRPDLSCAVVSELSAVGGPLCPAAVAARAVWGGDPCFNAVVALWSSERVKEPTVTLSDTSSARKLAPRNVTEIDDRCRICTVIPARCGVGFLPCFHPFCSDCMHILSSWQSKDTESKKQLHCPVCWVPFELEKLMPAASLRMRAQSKQERDDEHSVSETWHECQVRSDEAEKAIGECAHDMNTSRAGGAGSRMESVEEDQKKDDQAEGSPVESDLSGWEVAALATPKDNSEEEEEQNYGFVVVA